MPVAFLDLIKNCAPQSHVETITAIASVESNFQPFAIRINSDYPLGDQPTTKAQAIETATTLIAEGHDIDLGLGGINSGDLGKLGLSVSDTFEVCLNVQASAALLGGYYRVALQDGATAAQAEVDMLRSYFGNGDASIGKIVGYDKKVLAERERLFQTAKSEVNEVAELPVRERAGATSFAAPENNSIEQNRQRSQTSAPRWDVFNSARRSSVLVFSDGQ